MKEKKQIDYIKLGEQTRRTRREMSKLFELSYGLPISLRKHIVASIDKLEDFKNEADDHMFDEEFPGASPTVFYGANQIELEQKGEIKHD